ncbi:MAG: DUF4097 family beta strand repeat-containing protein [Rubricoccaceae bacterium]|nr:DUF4097 family beta strand repeat-containing protein [Rubricoccaceae bacterium]
MSREKIQRLALVALVVCAGALIGNRLLHGRSASDHAHAHPHDRHADEAFEAEMEAMEAEMETLEAKMEGPRGAPPSALSARAVAGRDEVLFERSFPVQPGDRLDVALTSDDLVVETGPGEATVMVLGRGRDARDAFPRRRFSADYSGGTLRVATDPDRASGRQRSDRASYTVVVRAPARLAAELHLASGDVEIGSLVGDLTIGTASGDIALDRVTDGARIQIQTASGDVRAALLDGETVTVRTASGDVSLERLAAGAATLHTASGDLAVEAVGASRLEAHTGSGDLALGRLDADDLRIRTGSGDAAVQVERALPLDVRTGSGDVALILPRAGFDVALDGPSIQIHDALDFQGRRARRSAEGRLGGGGPRLAVTTGGGDIALRAR